MVQELVVLRVCVVAADNKEVALRTVKAGENSSYGDAWGKYMGGNRREGSMCQVSVITALLRCNTLYA